MQEQKYSRPRLMISFFEKFHLMSSFFEKFHLTSSFFEKLFLLSKLSFQLNEASGCRKLSKLIIILSDW